MIKFLKQFFIYGFASVLGKIAAVFLLPLYTNVLTQNEFGALAMITATKGIIDVFSNLNIHSGIARDYYEKDIDRTKIISTGFYSIIFFSLSIMAILMYTRDFWITRILNVESYEKAFVFMLLTMPAGSLFTYFGILTRFKQKALLFSIGNLLQLTVQISFTIYYILIIKTGIVGVFYGMLIGELLGIVYFFFLNREYIRFTFHKSLLSRILKYSLPSLPAILAIWADSNIGQLFIGKYISLSEAGIYSIALRIASVYLLIRIAFENVWHPFVYEHLQTKDFGKIVMKIYNAATITLIVISVNLSILSEEIILLLSSTAYKKASVFLILLTIPMSLSILNQFVTIGPNISRKTKYISYANVLGSMVNLSCLAVLLPNYGAIIVPICLMLSGITVFLLSSYYTKREINLKFSYLNIFYLIISVGIALLFLQITDKKLLHYWAIIVFNVVSLLLISRKYNILKYLKK